MPQPNGKRNLTTYFTIAFAISWITWIPAIMLKTGQLTPILLFVGLFGPAISAIIVTGKSDGIAGVKRLLAGYKRLRFKLWLWLMAFLFIPLIFLASAVILSTPTAILTANSPTFLTASFAFLMFVNSGEEIGWRGFALPRLQDANVSKKFNALIASVILGIIWAIWHLPIYLVPGQSGFPYPLFFAFTVGVSIVYTAISNCTKGSCLLLRLCTQARTSCREFSALPISMPQIDLWFQDWYG
jgi:membrane protease YdiL (CAAX protease family)